MSKIRANSQVIPGTVARTLIDTTFESDLVQFSNDIAGLSANKADITYVDSEIASLIGGAPEALNTLNELAAALADDANFATTVTNQLTALDGRITTIENDTGYIKAVDLVRGEVPTGVIDGVNAVFTMAKVARTGSVMVFKNGVADFSPDITVDEVNKTVTFAVAPLSGDKIHVCYEAVRA